MSLVSIEREDHLGWVFMNRPDKYNALNTQLMRELIHALDELERDEKIKIIVLSGYGKVFSSGADLLEIASKQSPEEVEEIFSVLRELFLRLMSLSKPLVIALNGDAYGGGAEMIWAGDIVVAVEDARIGWVEARWGLVPPALTTIGLTQLGFAKAAMIAMSSGVVSAKELYEAGVVSRLVKRENLRDEVRALTRSILENNSYEALLSIRKILRSTKTKLLDELGLSELMRLSRSSELIKRAKNFIEKKELPKYL